MALNFSNEFINKYKDNTSMQEIIERMSPIIESIEATDDDKSLILETLYGFKETISKDYGIDMEVIYSRVENLERILNRLDGHLFSVGCCKINENLDERPMEILYNDKIYSGKGYDFRRYTLIHELCHLYTIDVTMEDGKRVYVEGNLNRGVEEIFTEQSAIKIANFLGYYNETTAVDVVSPNSEFRNLYYMCDGCGYQNIYNFGHQLSQIYGEVEMFREKYLRDGSVASVIIDGKTIADITEKIEKNNSNYLWFEDRMEIQAELSEILIKKYKENDVDIATYLKDMRSIHDKGVIIELDNGGQEKVCTISSYFQGFEITKFYKEINPDADIVKELNPLTRSEDCKNFLVILEALKGSDIEFSQEDLISMTYQRVKTNDGYKIAFIFNNEGHEIAYSYSDKFGLISSSEIENLSFSSRLGSVFKFSSDKANGEISMNDIMSIVAYNGSFNSIMELIKTTPDAVPKEIGLLAACVTSGMNEENEKYLKDAIKNIDLENIRYSGNNNLLHVLSNTREKGSIEILRTMAEYHPDEMRRLLCEKNDAGLTPMEQAVININPEILKIALELDLNKEFKALISEDGKNFIVGKEYVSVGSIVLGWDNKDTILKAIKLGIDANCSDTIGQTIVNLYVEGKISEESLREFLNAGADINGGIVNPLKEPIKAGDIEKIETLLKYDVNPNCIEYLIYSDFVESDGKEISLFNKKKGEQILSILVDAGADLNFVDSRGMNLLQSCSGICYNEPDYKIIQFLVENGADPFDNGDGRRYSLRDYAAEKADVKIFEIMIEAGIDIGRLDLAHSNLNDNQIAFLSSIEPNAEISRCVNDDEKASSTEKEESKEIDTVKQDDNGVGLTD